MPVIFNHASIRPENHVNELCSIKTTIYGNHSKYLTCSILLCLTINLHLGLPTGLTFVPVQI